MMPLECQLCSDDVRAAATQNIIAEVPLTHGTWVYKVCDQHADVLVDMISGPTMILSARFPIHQER